MSSLDELREILRASESVVVAYSGGVDSALVLKVAVDVLGPGALAITGRSPSVPAWEIEEAVELARTMGALHRLVDTLEVDDPSYAKNDADRCYHCKTELFTRLEAIRAEEARKWVVDGTNLDDLGDVRPGMRARRERGVRSPLVEARMSKGDVREASRVLGLPTADKPAFACLASRFPHGTPVTREGLRQVEAAEDCVRQLGFRQYRVRHHGDVARLELDPADLARAVDPKVREKLIEGIRRSGYRFVAIDLEGYRTGSLNEILPATILTSPGPFDPTEAP